VAYILSQDFVLDMT